MVSLLEIIIYSTIMAVEGYIVVYEHAIDQYEINWTRFGHYVFATCILMIYTHCMGQAFAALIMNPMEILVILSTVGFIMVMMLNDFFFKTDELPQVSLRLISDAVG